MWDEDEKIVMHLMHTEPCHTLIEILVHSGILAPTREIQMCHMQTTHLRHSSWQAAAQKGEAQKDVHSCQRSCSKPLFSSALLFLLDGANV